MTTPAGRPPHRRLPAATARSAHPRRHLASPLAAVVVALALALVAGCSHSDPVLTVDGWSLSRADFQAELEQVAHSRGYVAARQAADPGYRVYRPGTTDYDPSFEAELLNERITFRLVEAELARRGVTVTDADRQAALGIVTRQLADGAAAAGAAGTTLPGAAATTVPGAAAGVGPTVPPATVAAGGPLAPPGTGIDPGGKAVLDSLGPYGSTLVDGVAAIRVLQQALAGTTGADDEARLRGAYDQLADRIADQACVRHLLIRSAGGADADAAALQAADQAKARIDAGEDFATVAAQLSQDTATAAKGGDLGCGPRGQYDGAFEEAVWSLPPGTVSGPVKSTYGYHLVQVTDRRRLAFEDLRAKLRDALAQQDQAALEQWLAGAAKAAAVVVDPAFGRWDPTTGAVVPAGGGTDLSLVPDQPGTSLPGGPITTAVGPLAPTTAVGGAAPTTATSPLGPLAPTTTSPAGPLAPTTTGRGR